MVLSWGLRGDYIPGGTVVGVEGDYIPGGTVVGVKGTTYLVVLSWGLKELHTWWYCRGG